MILGAIRTEQAIVFFLGVHALARAFGAWQAGDLRQAAREMGWWVACEIVWGAA